VNQCESGRVITVIVVTIVPIAGFMLVFVVIMAVAVHGTVLLFVAVILGRNFVVIS
jgi:hypothetical protein